MADADEKGVRCGCLPYVIDAHPGNEACRIDDPENEALYQPGCCREDHRPQQEILRSTEPGPLVRGHHSPRFSQSRELAPQRENNDGTGKYVAILRRPAH